METNSNLCLFATATGIVCASCDNPPPESTYIGEAPEGTPLGPVMRGKLPESQPSGE